MNNEIKRHIFKLSRRLIQKYIPELAAALDGPRNIGLLTIQPPDATACPRIFVENENNS
jgi:hypothetical protein